MNCYDVPKREIETTEIKTEVIEEKDVEEVLICDSCGVNHSSNDASIYTYHPEHEGESLYFCEHCLYEDEKTVPITKRVRKSAQELDINAKGMAAWVVFMKFTLILFAIFAFGSAQGLLISAGVFSLGIILVKLV